MNGRDFAAAHGNDSTDWTAADFETEINLAEIDAQPAWKFIQQRLTAKPAAALTPAA